MIDFRDYVSLCVKCGIPTYYSQDNKEQWHCESCLGALPDSELTDFQLERRYKRGVWEVMSTSKTDRTMLQIQEDLISVGKLQSSLRGSFFDLYRTYDDGDYDCSIDEIEQKMIDTLKNWFLRHREVVDLKQERNDHIYKSRD